MNERVASWSRNSASGYRSRSPPNTTKTPRPCAEGAAPAARSAVTPLVCTCHVRPWSADRSILPPGPTRHRTDWSGVANSAGCETRASVVTSLRVEKGALRVSSATFCWASRDASATRGGAAGVAVSGREADLAEVAAELAAAGSPGADAVPTPAAGPLAAAESRARLGSAAASGGTLRD